VGFLMTIDGIDITATLDRAREILKNDLSLSDSFKMVLETLLLIIELLLKRLGINSKNSSKPPSQDVNRKRLGTRLKSDKKRGGQLGHEGSTLTLIDNPDEIIFIPVDRSTLSSNDQYTLASPIKRQVCHIVIKNHVIEYQAEVLVNQQKERFVAPFPNEVTNSVQYGDDVKAHSVYLSVFQLIPFHRLEEYFRNELEIPISSGSLFSFNQKACELLQKYEAIIKQKLIHSMVLNSDETGFSLNGKRRWIHTIGNDRYTFYYPHSKRGSEAIDEMGIIPNFSGVLIHDHWKPYFKYGCDHALCNAHLLRELELVIEYDHHQWAHDMKKLLVDTNKLVKDKLGLSLESSDIKQIEQFYQNILESGTSEFPKVDTTSNSKKRKAQSKTKNLFDRFHDYQTEILRFIHNPLVPFTNNQGENDLRMVKVQQKVSGCFRTMEGAKIFCTIRGFLSTCRKNGVSATEALQDLFNGKLPNFLYEPIPPPE